MVVWQFALLGAAGGALVEVLSLLRWIVEWANDRRKIDGRLKKKSRPRWRTYIDLPVHAWLLAIRIPLGAVTAWLFAQGEQISGAYAAVAFGFAAPAVLAQFGSIPMVTDAIRSDPRNAAALAEPAGHSGQVGGS